MDSIGPKPQTQATPAATGEALVTVVIVETHDFGSRTVTYTGTIQQVMVAQRIHSDFGKESLTMQINAAKALSMLSTVNKKLKGD